MPLQPPIPILQNWVRVTMFMRGPTKTWTESHWNTTAGASLSTVLADFMPIAVYRTGILAANNSMIEIRASAENVQGDSAIIAGSALPASPWTATEYVGNDDLKIRCESGVLNRKTLYLGAIPDVAAANDKYVPNMPPGYALNMASYLGNLTPGLNSTNTTPGPWGFLGIDKTQTKFKVQSIVSTVVVGTPDTNATTVTTFLPHGFLAGDVVRIKGRSDASRGYPWNQLWQVGTVPSGTTFTISLPYDGQIGFNAGPMGTVQKQVKIFKGYTAAFIGDPGTRKRGGRTNLLVGRSKRRHIGYS